MTERLCYCGRPTFSHYAHCRRCWERYSEYGTSDIAKQRRNDRRDACRIEGVCTHCQKAIADDGYSRCATCRDKHRIHSENQRKRRGGPDLHQSKRMAHLYDERRDKGLCYRCGKPATPNYKTCKGCRNKYRLYARKYRALKLRQAILDDVAHAKRFRVQ